MDFTDKTILITGASSGIGKEAAIKFAKHGANLILVARRTAKLETLSADLKKKFGVRVLACKCDVSDKSNVQQMANTVLEEFQKIDILVNNAGFAIYGSVNNLTIDEIESQMKTNYLGMTYCVKTFLPSMLQNRSGHIVNVASVAASFGLPGIASYCATKHAMLGFSEGLKHELHGTGIGVTVVSPIMVRTNFFDHPSFEKMPKYSPMSLTPQGVADAILRASSSPRLEIIVPSPVRLVVWLKQTFPYLINPILGRFFKNQIDKTERI